jgi:hypothetical protein
MWWLVVAIPTVVLGGLSVLVWMGARERRGAASELALIRAMSESDAEKVALGLMTRPPFHVRKARAPLSSPELPSHVRSLFDRYEEVVCGEFRLATEALTQPARLPGFIKIGEDSEFTEILVRLGDPRIYISYGEGPQSEKTMETEPTIWHAIIVASGSAPQRNA